MSFIGTFLTLVGGFGLYKLIKGNKSNTPLPRTYQKYIYLVAGLGIFLLGKSDISPVAPPISKPASTQLVSTSSTTSETLTIKETTTSKKEVEEQLALQKKKDKLEKEKLELKKKTEEEQLKRDAEKKKKETVARTTLQTKRQTMYTTLANKIVEDVQTFDVDKGIPDFTQEELSLEKGAWESYGNLDHLNRPTIAEAMLNQSLMPTEKRVGLNVDPTGWHNKKTKKGYLYNRSHLIGFQLTGQNNNLKNLITGTQQLNNPEMLRFEMDIAYYLEQNPNHYIRYTVIPVFKDNELLARGVHLKAQSIGDNDVQINVFIANIQNDVILNYSDGTSQLGPSQEVEPEQATETPKQTASPIQHDTAPLEQPTEQAQDQTVYITATGKKYHFSKSCRGLNNANAITQTVLSTAERSGLTKCKWE